MFINKLNNVIFWCVGRYLNKISKFHKIKIKKGNLLKKLLLILTLSILSFASTVPNNSVVKIFTTATSPNYLEPWENPSFSNATGSGVIIKDNQILTSAHIVSGGKFIEVQKENDSKKYESTIKGTSKNRVKLQIIL